MATCRTCGAGVPGRRQKCDDCKAGRTPAAEPEPTRGERLRAALAGDGTDLARAALALEAGRCVDRLDELDRIIAGDGVTELMRFRQVGDGLFTDGGDAKTVTIQVKFDSVLGESRQQQNNLRQLLQALGLDAAPAASGTGKPKEDSPLAAVLALVPQPGARP